MSEIQSVANIAHWRQNPAAQVHDLYGVDPDPWQKKVLEAFASQDPDKQRISMQACVGPGKSAVLAWCGLNFLTCYGDRDNHPKGAAVSVSEENLRTNLWAEFSRWMQRSEFLSRMFTWTSSKIFLNEHPETWFISARSWPKTAEPEELGKTLSGMHSKFVLALIDESGTIPVQILRAAEQSLSNCEFGKIVQAGNPISRDGMLYVAATVQRALWFVVRVTGDPDDPNRSPRINLQWAKEQIALYGRNDPWVKSSILGEFPESSINALLSVEEVNAAMGRHLPKETFNWSQKRLGIDAARYGADPWVIFPRQGLASFKPVEMRGPTTQEAGNRVIAAKEKWHSEREYFDGTGGFSAGAVDYMRAAGYSPMEIHFAGRDSDSRFANIRAGNWWRMAQWVKKGAAMAPLPEMVGELTEVTYSFDSNGRLLIEPKEAVKQRLGRSPNYADALSLTFSEPDIPRDFRIAHRAQRIGGELFHPITAGRLPADVDPDFDPHRTEAFL